MSISTLPSECPTICWVCQLRPPVLSPAHQLQFLRSALRCRGESGMGHVNRHVLEISTYVFRALRRLAPLCISCSEEKDSPTQRIVVDDDVYSEIIDRAIAKRKTVDEVFLEIGRRRCPALRRSRCIKRWRR
jgi:hypothetical protein